MGTDHGLRGRPRLREGVQVQAADRHGLPLHAEAAGELALRAGLRRAAYQLKRAMGRGRNGHRRTQDRCQAGAEYRRRLSLRHQ